MLALAIGFRGRRLARRARTLANVPRGRFDDSNRGGWAGITVSVAMAGETPGPIPNPEVKPSRADGTAPATGWESRSPPRHLERRPPRWGPSSSPTGVRIVGSQHRFRSCLRVRLVDGGTFFGSKRQGAGRPRVPRPRRVAFLISGRASRAGPFPRRSGGSIARRPEGSIPSTNGR